MGKNSRRRNYRTEYDDYYGEKHKPNTWSALQKKRRQHKTSRNAARAIMKKKYGVKKIKNMDINHKDHNPLNNHISNLEIQSIKKNRSNKY